MYQETLKKCTDDDLHHNPFNSSFWSLKKKKKRVSWCYFGRFCKLNKVAAPIFVRIDKTASHICLMVIELANVPSIKAEKKLFAPL